MGDQHLTISMAGQPLQISNSDNTILINTATETLQIQAEGGAIHFTIKEERLEFSTPWVMEAAQQGASWPFGSNAIKVPGVVPEHETLIDDLALFGTFRVVKWLLLVSDDQNGLAVTSEIKAMRHGESVAFMEYAIMGHRAELPYTIDVNVVGDSMQLSLINHANHNVTVRAMRIGLLV
uniref:Uncharacterized protein n=1 Tax=Magnetococcus massalia (strain MO-1) TaxID=451514 RepID=A0A1S7LGE9_MAGMO|nr:protein of unknown function [Candidatus Magnetococcus massalia]CRH06577.1 Protein of unknown function [Candidatus Magnetococcus massalia]